MSALSMKESYGHEERLQRLEETSQDLKAGLAVSAVKLENLEKTVGAGFERLENSLLPFTERLTNHIEDDGKVELRVARLENTETRRMGRANLLKKVSWALLTGLGGIITKEIVWFFAKLHH